MATLDRLIKICFSLVILSLNFKLISASDILGCGGFVKSHVNLDFSKIEIGLYTKGGSLKERTECAPTNGYYFLPLYEKGDYVLKVHPPAGWSFEPSQVELSVDGVTDACSTGQDINFAFNGFGITGRVITAGQKQGPSGIAVQLINEKGEKRDTVTSAGGDFHFTPVIPGKYTLKASHPKWKLEPSQAVVTVKEGNTALPVGVLAVKGYDVKGSVTSYGTPIAGIYVLLYSKEDPKFRVEGCKSALLQGVPDSPICHSVTDSSGEFSFGLVPAGEYKLLALSKNPGQASISYNIKSETLTFTVGHDSQYIKNAFEVVGFTVVGSVLTSVSGKGVSGARVLKDGVPVGNTDAAGKFTLPSLQPGTYTLSFKHELCEFDDVQLSITPTGPSSLPMAYATRWRVCGSVAPAGHSARDVIIQAEKGGVGINRVTPQTDGKWCTYLQSGVYSAKVDVSEAEQRDGLQFYPLTQKISVGHGPVEGISFSQLKATVRGKVKCLEKKACEGLKVTLRPLSPDGGYQGQPLYTVAVNGEYSFSSVLPGSVEVSVGTERLCWADARHNAAVAQEVATLPTFVHTGYLLRIHSSHDIEVEYKSKSSKGVLSVSSGASQHCMDHAEEYTLTPRGCHRFKPEVATVNIANEQIATVNFVAVSHAVVLRVLSPEAVNDLVMTISSEGSPKRTVGPLVPLQQTSGGYAFEHTLFMTEGEIAVVSAESSSLLFHPSQPQQVIGSRDCQPSALVIRALRGLTLKGAIVPPVPDVVVTLVSGDLKLTQTTTSSGTYSFGPLDASKDYTITAEKDSYVFSSPDEKGNIHAHKLAEIIVQVVDDADTTPLQGALVSVSGGSFRRNVVSGPSGELRFSSLSPGEYYVKPNMKEYRFSPLHHILHVTEGKEHKITLRGVRVAWSCVGSVASVGGVGWAGATVAAVPKGGPHCATEEATTDHDGVFRIRGLLPKCVYTLQLKQSATYDMNSLKLVGKEPPLIEIKENKDIENVRLIAIQPTQITDTNVLIYTPTIDHYKSLRLYLALDASPNTPIYSTKLDSTGYNQNMNPGLMYVLPRLPADNKTYVLTLTATLSKSMYSYEEQVQYFTSDGNFKFFKFEFLPEMKSSEQELRQTSLLVVPLALALALSWHCREGLKLRLTSWVSNVAAGGAGGKVQSRQGQGQGQNQARDKLLDKASIEHILSAVNAAGKKQPKKKAQ